VKKLFGIESKSLRSQIWRECYRRSYSRSLLVVEFLLLPVVAGATFSVGYLLGYRGWVPAHLAGCSAAALWMLYAIQRQRRAVRFLPSILRSLGRCQRCGHLLTGATGKRCPECGQPRASAEPDGSSGPTAATTDAAAVQHGAGLSPRNNE
jgi:hypothetical protein